MINIGNISFRFRMADEVFAQQLYAGWDEFCRTCFTDILEEYLGRYDTKDSYIEIDTLELNIGSIPQESFYEEFPKRVRAELERIVLLASVNAVSSSVSKSKRQDNLIHYLRHGFCLPGWDMQEFDLFEELMLFKDSEAIVVLCFSEQYCFERLTRQLDGWQLNIVLTHWLAVERHDEGRNLILQKWALRSPDALRMLTDIVAENRILSERIAVLIDNEGAGEWHLMLSWLTSTTLGHYEKQRYFAVVFETRPLMVMRFIRETSDEGNVKRLALLLESESVRRIMVAETESHAEVDVPEYWHHLYLWLIQHYPFNGVAMFGDKRHFVQHLHERFLFFIRKRSASTYLSKTDLTIRFLLEVFGADYYLEVLNILYHNQPLNDDGSPVSSDYYSREIYYMLLRLSLIKAVRGSSSGISIDGADDVPSDEVYELIGSFEEWLTGSALATNEKRILLRRLVKEQPQQVLRWLQSASSNKVLPLFVELVHVEDIFALVAAVSYQDSVSLSAAMRSLAEVKSYVSWMQGVDIVRLEKAYIIAVVPWLSSGRTVQGTELIKAVLGSVYLVVIRGREAVIWDISSYDEAIPIAVEEVVAVLAEKSVIDVSDDETGIANISVDDDIAVAVSRLRSVLENKALPVTAKKRLLLRWIDAHRDDVSVLFKAIYEAGMLTSVILLLDEYVLRHLIIRMAGLVTVGSSSSAFVLFVNRMTMNVRALASAVSVSVEEVWEGIIVQLVTLMNHPNTAIDATISLIDAIGNHTATTDAFRHIIRLYEVSATDVSPDDALTLLMLRVKEQISLRGRTDADDGDLNVVRMAFEHSLNDNKNILAWLKSSRHSITSKQKVVKQFATREPQAFMSLLQMSLNEDTLAVWSDVVEIGTLVSVSAKVDRVLAGNILMIVSVIQRSASKWRISLGGYSSVEDSLTKAMLRFIWEYLIRGGRLPDGNVIVKAFVSYWREVVTGRKEVVDTDIEIWKEIETHIASELKIAVKDTGDNESKTIGTQSVSSETDVEGYELTSERLKRMSRSEIAEIPEARFWMLNETDFDVLAIWLSSSKVSDTVKIRLLQRYARWQQKVFWNFIGYVYAKGTFDVLSLGAWLGMEEWLMLVAGVSYSWAETLRQTIEIIHKREGVSNAVLSAAFALFVTKRSKDDWYRYDTVAVIKDYVASIRDTADKYGKIGKVDEIEKIFADVVAELHASDEEASEIEEAMQPEYISVTNAGLCLLTPWVIRLLSMLDLLTEDKKDLKDMDARIRAIFILQRLVTAEQREYKESDLAFNRVLVACPFNVPLPKRLELTDKEIETVESMLAGVKANWSKMENTSIGGFQRSFIEREGQLEQRENKWVLTVEDKAYDILLDSLPWSYKMIRFPWLKKPISVSWRDKEEFDFDSINR